MAHEIINRQRRFKIDPRSFDGFLQEVSSAIEDARGRSATIVFVSDLRMRGLNREFRGKDATTDVLSFPFASDDFGGQSEHLGDVVISMEQAARQAKENGLTLGEELRQLILHGILHLCGHDHETDEGEMNRLELKLRRKLKI